METNQIGQFDDDINTMEDLMAVLDDSIKNMERAQYPHAMEKARSEAQQAANRISSVAARISQRLN